MGGKSRKGGKISKALINRTIAITGSKNPTKRKQIRELAEQANEHHQKAMQAGKEWMKNARRCGRALIKAKKLVPHGHWAGWLERNFHASPETALLYRRMYKYRNHPVIKQLRAEGREPETMNAFFRALKHSKTKKATKKKDPLDDMRQSILKRFRWLLYKVLDSDEVEVLDANRDLMVNKIYHQLKVWVKKINRRSKSA